MERFVAESARAMLDAADTCPPCPLNIGKRRRAVLNGLRSVLLPECDPCKKPDRPAESSESKPESKPEPKREQWWEPTRGSCNFEGTAVGTLSCTDDSVRDSRQSYTLYQLCYDGPRNECDYRIYLGDEQARTRPITMEKRRCVRNDDLMVIEGRQYRVHIAGPRYNPFGPHTMY